ncbi:lysophospholipid acyltransferase family protein [Falsibacillus albus]|uniref:1-acyl-sn-glycerol-3-phosphate acyltransferase n=1 Tax=Falsibacillus albus TaxID=2478915 RepID=A0A3L7K2Z8_9BACI|nr:lysophospholipid acyltransferase family protein [Falsibacillus albus]RLQ95082.1 1-acyl-sn-glycerol-3-phosphate acyltransferase [Falsibacillus albus]
MTFYTIARGIVAAVVKPLYRIEVIGAEKIPVDGGVLICSNHINNFDPLSVGTSVKRPVCFMAKEELFKVPVLGKIVANLNAFPVKRGMSDREALRRGLAVLKEGKVLGLFPEGTRSKTGKLGKGLAGAGFFALRTNAAVVPCAVIGEYKALKKVKVVFGDPIDMLPLREGKASAEEATEVIMAYISDLIEKHQR